MMDFNNKAAAINATFAKFLTRAVKRVQNSLRPTTVCNERQYDSAPRYGCFFIADAALLNPDGLQILFDDMVVIDCRHQWNGDRQRYVAWHPDFDIVAEGETFPEYFATFEPGSVKPKWKRIS